MKKFMKYFKKHFPIFLYIILLNVSVVLVTVSMHEFGHYTVGTALGCENMKIIILDSVVGNTYTQMNCPLDTNVILIAFGGFLYTTIFGLLFILLKKLEERYLGVVVIGFNLTISSSDLALVTNTLLPIVLVFIGLIVTIIGETLLTDKLLYKYRRAGS